METTTPGIGSEAALFERILALVAESGVAFTLHTHQPTRTMENALFVFITVGTPPREDGSCDLSYVYQVATDIGANMKDYKIVVDKSTVPVGTADEVRKRIAGELAKRGETIEFDVVSNPEFLKEGDAINDFFKPDRVVVGTDNVRTGELLKALYAPYARSREKVIVMSASRFSARTSVRTAAWNCSPSWVKVHSCRWKSRLPVRGPSCRWSRHSPSAVPS